MILYYSATNNSKEVAKILANRKGEKIISITDLAIEKCKIDMRDEQCIGFVIPTYFYGIPNLVNDFLKNLEMLNAKDKYIYLVLTCGLNTANAAEIVRKRLELRGYHLDAIYAVKMIDTYVMIHRIPNEAEIQLILENAYAEIEIINNQIKQRKRGDFNFHKGIMPKVMTAILYPFYKKGRKTRKFYTTKKCNGCGKCEKECPVKAIRLQDKVPIWEKRQCELCLKCLHSCPMNAIEYGKSTIGKGRYVYGIKSK